MRLNQLNYPRKPKRVFKSTEKETQTAVLDFLHKNNIFHYRNNSGAIRTDKRFFRFGATGSPDIICVKNGKYIGIECKDVNGKLSESQVNFSINLTRAGGSYIVVHSIDEFLKLWSLE